MTAPLPWEAARERVVNGVAPMPASVMPVREAFGRCLAEDVVAPESMPPFDNSAMDGFGVRADDVTGAAEGHPVRLGILGDLPAGRSEAPALTPGTAVRVMTGAPIPRGADAIVPIEHTDLWDPAVRGSLSPRATEVGVLRPARPGQNIRRAGESVAAGETFLEAGHRLGPAEIALLISVGIMEVNVHSLPRVGILSTGDELVPPEATPGPGQIRDSNRVALLLLLQGLGYPTVDLGLVRDDSGELAARVRKALPRIDFLLTSGGVSVGDRDFTRRVLAGLGPVEAYAVAVKPGKPQLFGHIDGVPVFGLPGNPVSSLVVCDIFVLPALRRMAGRRDLHPPVFEAELAEPLRRRPGRTEFVRVHLEIRDGRWVARSAGPQGSGVLGSMTRGNGYAMIAEDADSLEPGNRVSCLWMHWD